MAYSKNKLNLDWLLLTDAMNKYCDGGVKNTILTVESR